MKDGEVRLVVPVLGATEIEIWDIPPQPADDGGNTGKKGNTARSFDGKDDYVFRSRRMLSCH
ncbi:MAG: hypothetical protein IID45_03780 [Planctomycetes bacterium]|nr:hypothetical protein [Planctomycetota bacterium]